jgi:hypothetical protein
LSHQCTARLRATHGITLHQQQQHVDARDARFTELLDAVHRHRLEPHAVANRHARREAQVNVDRVRRVAHRAPVVARHHGDRVHDTTVRRHIPEHGGCLLAKVRVQLVASSHIVLGQRVVGPRAEIAAALLVVLGHHHHHKLGAHFEPAKLVPAIPVRRRTGHHHTRLRVQQQHRRSDYGHLVRILDAVVVSVNEQTTANRGEGNVSKVALIVHN